MLEPRLQAEILRLHFSQGLSRRAIARQLEVHRTTVAEVIARRQVRLCAAERNRRASILEPYYPRIEKLLEDASERSACKPARPLKTPQDFEEADAATIRDIIRRSWDIEE